jgi:hypothetical protein
MLKKFLLISSIILGICRLIGFKYDLFKTIAHLIVAYMFGLGTRRKEPDRKFFLVTATCLSVLELICFLAPIIYTKFFS